MRTYTTVKGMRVGEIRVIMKKRGGRHIYTTMKRIRSKGFPQYTILETEWD